MKKIHDSLEKVLLWIQFERIQKKKRKSYPNIQVSKQLSIKFLKKLKKLVLPEMQHNIKKNPKI